MTTILLVIIAMYVGYICGLIVAVASPLTLKGFFVTLKDNLSDQYRKFKAWATEKINRDK